MPTHRLRSSGRALTLAALFSAALPAPAVAQDQSAWDGKWVLTATLGGVDTAEHFGPSDGCARSVPGKAIEAGVSVRRNLGPHLGLEAGSSYASAFDLGAECVIAVAPWPPFYTGTHRTTATRHGSADGSLLRTSLRAVARAAHRDTELRLSLGADLAPSYRAYGPAGGLGVAFGTGPWRLLIQADGWLPTFPLRTETSEWVEGAVISHTEERYRSDAQAHWTLRVGVELHPALR